MKPVLRTFSILILSALAAQAFAQEEICPGCKVDETLAKQADAALVVAPTNEQRTGDAYLPFGLPIGPAETAPYEMLLYQRSFVESYDEGMKIPVWVAYKLSAADVTASLPRKDCFRTDPRVPASAEATCGDYEEPEFDRGHMVPSADMKRDRLDQLNTFLFTNMAPQYPNFNQKLWEDLEGRVRSWAVSRGEIHVISGAVFDRNGDGRRDPDDDTQWMSTTVAIPTHFYKIVMVPKSDGTFDTIAIMLTHDGDPAYRDKQFREQTLSQGVCRIADIQKVTGIDFLPGLPEGPRRDYVLGHIAKLSDWAR